MITIEKCQFQKVKKIGLFRGFTNVALHIFENFKLFPANDLDFDLGLVYHQAPIPKKVQVY